MFIFDQDKYWEAVNRIEAERSDGLDDSMPFESALNYYFRNENEQRRKYLVNDLLGKKKNADLLIDEIAGYLGTDSSFLKDKHVLDIGAGSVVGHQYPLRRSVLL